MDCKALRYIPIYLLRCTCYIGVGLVSIHRPSRDFTIDSGLGKLEVLQWLYVLGTALR